MADIKGRPDIKQYYAGGLRYKHIEPVPQSGFRLMAGTDRIAAVRANFAPHAFNTLRAKPRASWVLLHLQS
ncbi:MAG: hypothetical protein U5K75_00090 [Ahrensia sp.]|nr:hypothetical protein [Ahrensia sp.]